MGTRRGGQPTEGEGGGEGGGEQADGAWGGRLNGEDDSSDGPCFTIFLTREGRMEERRLLVSRLDIIFSLCVF